MYKKHVQYTPSFQKLIQYQSMNQLRKKYNSDATFRSQMDDAQKKYTNSTQRAFYSTFSKLQEQVLKYAGKDQQGDAIYLIYGDQQQNSQKKSVEKFYLYLINVFEQFLNKSSSKFVIIYFNTFCEDSNAYSSFRSLYRSLPLKYFESLKRLIIVNASFSLKAIDWIVSGTINKHLKNKTQYIDRIQDLKDFKITLSDQFLDKIRQQIRKVDYPNLKREKPKFESTIKFNNKPEQKPQNLMTRSNINLNRKNLVMEKPNQQIKYNNQIKNTIIDPTRKNLTEYEVSDIGIPILLKSMIMFLKMKPQYLQEEGIFRKCVSIIDQKQVQNQLFNGNYDYLQNVTNPHIIATLIKKFFNNLKEPLIPYQLYDIFAKTPGIIDNLEQIKSTFKKLPILNYITLMFLLSFFIDQVISKQKLNKMPASNVAIVLLPCLMRARQSGIQDLMYSKKLACLLEVVIKNFDEIFGNKKQQNKIYRRSSRESQKKFEQEYIIQNQKTDERQDIIKTFQEGNTRKQKIN